MDARPTLVRLARLLNETGLEAILIGNAAAAIQGAPVTTMDFDFLFRATPANLKKVKAIAGSLGAEITRPFEPASDLIRLLRKDEFLQIDLVTTVHGAKSFEGLRARASRVDFDGCTLLVAGLSDIIKSKKKAGRSKDRAVLYVLEETLREKKKIEKENP